MQRCLMSAAAAVLALTVGGTAMASERESGRRTFEYERVSFHESFHGHRFEHGYYFHSRDHYRFHHKYFNHHYGTYCYYDEYTRCEYYFCEPDSCYYPMSYCPYGRFSW
jgi:hypothetical protein